MSDHYILEGRNVRPVDLMTWARWYETAKRHVADITKGGVRVSTIFLGLDHRFSDGGPPILFETMIFGGEHDSFQERCSTYEQAEEMHKRACTLAGIQQNE